MGVDVDQTGLDLRDPVRIVGGIGLLQQRIALEIGLEHHLDQALRPVWRFLRQTPDAPARRDGNGSALDRQFAANGLEKRGFAGPVAADQTYTCAGYDLGGTLIDQEPSGEADGDVGDGKHGGLSPQPAANATALSRDIEVCSLSVILGYPC